MDKGTCAVAACDRPVRSREWCNAHYQRFLRSGDPLGTRFVDKLCSVEGCDGEHASKGLCALHYSRLTRYGDVNHGRPAPNRERTCSVDECESPILSRSLCGLHYGRMRRTGTTDLPERAKVRRRPDEQPCSVEDCDRPVKSRGLCTYHYNAWQRSPEFVPLPPAETRPCSVSGCLRDTWAVGLCTTHYQRKRQHGDIDPERPIGYREPPNRRCEIDGCDRPHAALGMCSVHVQRWRYRRSNRTEQERRDFVDWLSILRSDPCMYCGNPMEHVDHIRAVAKGGGNDWWNLAATCRSCNTSKRTRDVLQFMLIRLDEEGDGESRSVARRSSGPARAARTVEA